MVMKFMLLPWKPELVFTGTSIMGINPQTGKFSSHLVKSTSLASVKMINYETPTKIPVIFFLFNSQDFWDSIENNNYFSLEGLRNVVKQVHVLYFFKFPLESYLGSNSY
jgi:hypothetical protein